MSLSFSLPQIDHQIECELAAGLTPLIIQSSADINGHVSILQVDSGTRSVHQISCLNCMCTPLLQNVTEGVDSSGNIRTGRCNDC